MATKSDNFDFLDKPFLKESLRMNDERILRIRINVVSGTESDIWVYAAPSIDVSGYGPTKEEAKLSFKHNLDVFVEAMNDASTSKRNDYLRELGWKQESIFKKRFSKAFVDGDGNLQNLENKSIDFETVAA